MNWSSKWNEPVSVGKDEGQAAVEAMQALGVPEIRTIKLGNKSIQVIVVGDLGLDFCEPGEKDEGWNIYHLPTLACFSSAVPPSRYMSQGDVADEFNYDNQALLNWMAKVQFHDQPYDNTTGGDGRIVDAWDELKKLTPSNYSDNGGTAKDIIKNWCLSVKVE